MRAREHWHSVSLEMIWDISVQSLLDVIFSMAKAPAGLISFTSQ
jgi:hypothetical protein